MNVFLSALIVLVLAGCTEKSVNQRKAGPLFSGSSSPRISSYSALHSRLRMPTYTSESTTLSAGLQPDTAGNTVTFNGLALTGRTINGHTSYSRMLGPGSAYINLSGGMNTFRISGAWATNFSDSLPGPSATTQITSPGLGDTVRKSTGFTVTWSPTSSGAGAAVSLLDSGAGARNCGVKTFASDPGSMTFMPSDLACLNTGPLRLTVDRGYYRMDSLSPTQYIQLTLGSSEIVQVYLAP